MGLLEEKGGKSGLDRIQEAYDRYIKGGNPIPTSPADIGGGGGGGAVPPGGGEADPFIPNPDADNVTDVSSYNPVYDYDFAEGGQVGAWDTSFTPHMNIGGLPVGGMPQYDQSNTYTGYNDTNGAFVPR
jgi:hypothetical protein